MYTNQVFSICSYFDDYLFHKLTVLLLVLSDRIDVTRVQNLHCQHGVTLNHTSVFHAVAPVLNSHKLTIRSKFVVLIQKYYINITQTG